MAVFESQSKEMTVARPKQKDGIEEFFCFAFAILLMLLLLLCRRVDSVYKLIWFHAQYQRQSLAI